LLASLLRRRVVFDMLTWLTGYWGSVLTNNGQKKNTLPLATLTGAMAGATESFVVTPFELVKIRLQDKKSTFKGPLDVIRHSFRTSGPLG
jgi:solute carrier family 25 2-oxodicarboxylate transporter 21